MPSTISLTYGINCQQLYWNAVKRELRNSCLDAQYSSFAMHFLDQANATPDFAHDLNVLLNQCVDRQAIRSMVMIQMLFESQHEADPAVARRLIEWAKLARQAAKAVGIWKPVVNLIWIVQDGCRNREAAQSLMGDDSAFDRRFVISTKRSDLTVARDTGYCWHGVSTLIRVLSEKPVFDASDMTIGFAKLQSSAADMHQYAKDQLANCLHDGTMNHDNLADLLKKERPNWMSLLLQELKDSVPGVFFYTPDGSDSMDMSKMIAWEQVEQTVQALVGRWGTELIEAAKKTPFPEDFLNALKGKTWQDQLQNMHREHLSAMDQPMKKQLIHGKLIEAYNVYLEQYKQRYGQVLQRFVDALTDETDNVRQRLQALIEQRNRIAQSFFADAQFVSRCELAFAGITNRIKSLSQTKRMNVPKNSYLGETGDSREAWEAFFDQCVVGMELKPQELLDELCKRDGNQIANLCDQNLDPEANTVYARMLHDNFSIDRYIRFYLLPQNVMEPVYQDDSPNSRHTIIRINVPDYGNIEKLVFAEISDPLGQLTSFQEQANEAIAGQPANTHVDQMDPMQFADSTEAKGLEEEIIQVSANQLSFHVNEDGTVSFIWPDISEKMLTLHLYDELNMTQKDVHYIVLAEFQSGGNKVVFDELIGLNGIYTVSLRNGSKVLASQRLELRKDLFVQDEQKEIRLGDRRFIKHTLKISNDLLENDDLEAYMNLIVGGQLVVINGKRKRKTTEWIVVMDAAETPELVATDRPGRCYRLIIG